MRQQAGRVPVVSSGCNLTRGGSFAYCNVPIPLRPCRAHGPLSSSVGGRLDQRCGRPSLDQLDSDQSGLRRSRQLAFDPGDEGLDPEPSELLAWLRDSRQSDSGQTGHCDVVKADDRKIAWDTQVVAVGELL